MNLRFNFEKSVQAAAYLLHLDGGRMERMRLLKLLYIADREMLSEVGRSITGDTGYAMNYGPVLSRVYNCIKGEDPNALDWEKQIQSEGHAVRLVQNSSRDDLSRAEIGKLNEVTERFRNQDEWDISEHTHTFQEWKDHYVKDSSASIPWEEMLKAQGASQMAESVVEDQMIADAFDNLLES